MKYAKEVYETGSYFTTTQNARSSVRVVRTRFTHTCILCDRDIAPQKHAISIQYYLPRTGVPNGHICLPCATKWLEATHQIESLKKIGKEKENEGTTQNTKTFC